MAASALALAGLLASAAAASSSSSSGAVSYELRGGGGGAAAAAIGLKCISCSNCRVIFEIFDLSRLNTNIHSEILLGL